MAHTGRLLSTADLVSLSRLVLAGAFALASGTLVRVAIVGLAGLTDYLDGFVARRGAAGRYGAIIDPAADRVFVVVVIATLVAENAMTLAQCLVLLARDIATTLGALVVRLFPRLRPARLEARWSGKVVTALQFVTLLAIIVEPSSLAWLLPVVGVASAVSIADYSAAIWRGRGAAIAAAALIVIFPALPAAAQTGSTGRPTGAQGSNTTRAPVHPVARADAFFARTSAAHAGLGVTTALGGYVRLDAVVGAGAARIGDETVASGRAELVGRFLLDPYRQSRWGFYGGGGLMVRHEEGPGTRGYLTLVLGAELPGTGLTTPALEVGLGGGTRVGLALRRGRRDRR